MIVVEKDDHSVVIHHDHGKPVAGRRRAELGGLAGRGARVAAARGGQRRLAGWG
jgi:hypothetical protein